ncbi:MAG TPA: nitroreductase family protein [Candidatus Ozemobacteraceae bacterium]|nr:nitroreductase family protein [Candidatus Ozemobacteraceae bacterium]
MTIDFHVDPTLCVKCGQCAKDCPSNIISLEGGLPFIKSGGEDQCIRCQHCLAVCPTGAVSILGKRPSDSLPLNGELPSPDAMELLIKGRRSVRKYVDENLPPETIRRLLEVAWHAPTGCNARGVVLTVVDDRNVMAKLRTELVDAIAAVAGAGKLPRDLEFFASFVGLWREKKIDAIFRGAPHMVISSAPADAPTPGQDTIIALSYFELFARSLGLGTLWCGLAKWAFTDIAPEFKSRLGIPANHQIGYVMPFGKPAVTYHRTVQHVPASVNYIT